MSLAFYIFNGWYISNIISYIMTPLIKYTDIAYNKVLQYFNIIPIHIKGDLHYIEFYHKGEFWKCIIPLKNNSNKYCVEVKTDDNNKSQIIRDCMGPNNDFYGNKLSPNMLGCESVKVSWYDISLNKHEKEYFGDDIIFN